MQTGVSNIENISCKCLTMALIRIPLYHTFGKINIKISQPLKRLPGFRKLPSTFV